MYDGEHQGSWLEQVLGAVRAGVATAGRRGRGMRENLRGMNYAEGAAALRPDPLAGGTVPLAENAPALSRLNFLEMLLQLPPVLTQALSINVMDVAHRRGLIEYGGAAGRPLDPVTRAEAALILARHAQIIKMPYAGEVFYFYDVFANNWFFDAAHVCRRFGIFQGYRNNCFAPQERLTREQAEDVIRRARHPRPLTLAEQRAAVDVEPLREPSARYPGTEAPAAAKYAFYLRALAATGHAQAHSATPNRYTLIGIRGFRAAELTALTPRENSNRTFDDVLVVLGQDAKGQPVVREYPGSTDPGVAGADQVVAGAYEYQYQGQGFTAVTGAKVPGAYYRMTPATYNGDWEVVHDSNGDNRYSEADGDRRVSEKGNYKYLIHSGPRNANGTVGGWSLGCQVIAGENAAGERNIDEASRYLNQNPGKSFPYVLIEGRELAKAMGGR